VDRRLRPGGRNPLHGLQLRASSGSHCEVRPHHLTRGGRSIRLIEEYGPSAYGDRFADIYDERPEVLALDTDAAVAFLAEHAGGGPVLELAVGTGRIAVPLAERGIDVHGIDASEAMVARLRSKPGGERIPVTIGDFADVPVEGRYTLVYVVFNTLFALQTQEAQVRCFENVAAHLADDGVFVVEAFPPDLTRFDRDQRTETMQIGLDHAWLALARHHPAEQRVQGQHVSLGEEGVRFYPVYIRYAYPSELDLMARLAGLRLRDRFDGWEGKPYTGRTQSGVSVYARVDGPA
jgi:SAM-dependent methyltransferase